MVASQTPSLSISIFKSLTTYANRYTSLKMMNDGPVCKSYQNLDSIHVGVWSVFQYIHASHACTDNICDMGLWKLQAWLIWRHRYPRHWIQMVSKALDTYNSSTKCLDLSEAFKRYINKLIIIIISQNSENWRLSQKIENSQLWSTVKTGRPTCDTSLKYKTLMTWSFITHILAVPTQEAHV